MRISGRRCSALLVGTALALSACSGGSDESPATKSSTSAVTPAAPALPRATADGMKFTVAAKPMWTTASLRLGKAEAVTVAGDTSIVSFETGAVAAVVTATGKVRWSYRETQRFKGGQGQELGLGSDTGPVTASTRGPLVIVEYYDSVASPNEFGLAALSVTTGRLLWARPVKARGGLTHDWRVRVVGASRDGVVLERVSGFTGADGSFATDDVETVVLDTATGRIRWRQAGIAPTALAGPTVVAIGPINGVVRAQGPPAGPLSARDLRTGRQLWQRPPAEVADIIGRPTRTTFVAEFDGRPRLVDAASGRTLSSGSVVAGCESDGAELLACLPDQRLVTYAATDGALRAGTVPPPPLDRVVPEIAQVDSGRIFIDRDDSSMLVVDRSGRTLATIPAYRFESASAGHLVLRVGEALGLYATSA